MKQPNKREIAFNPGRAQAVIDFIECLPITDGPAIGTNIVLDPWQRELIRDIYEPYYLDNGRRAVRRGVLSVARKNSKSFLTAGLLLAHLIGPEAEPNGKIYSAANDREQAAIIFMMVKEMIEMVPELAAILTVNPSVKVIYVNASHDENGEPLAGRGSQYKALSAEAGTKHGLNPSFVAYDELGQTKKRELLATLLTSQGNRAEPLFMVLSTQSHIPTSPLSEMIDDGQRTGFIQGNDHRDKATLPEDPTLVCHLYAADEDCDVLDRDQWIKANPCLLTWKTWDEITLMAERAARLPSEEAEFRNLYLNQRVNPMTPFIALSTWDGLGPPNILPTDREEDSDQLIPGEDIYLGLDMSESKDLTALVAVSVATGLVKPWFWKPEKFLRDHSIRDAHGYDVAHSRGWLFSTPGTYISPLVVAQQIQKVFNTYRVVGMAIDPNRTAELKRNLEDAGLPYSEDGSNGLRIVNWPQTFPSMDSAVRALEQAVDEQSIRHDGNPVMRFNIINAMTDRNGAGYRRIDKETVRFRIDGVVALAMAMGLRFKDIQETPKSQWEDPSYSWAKRLG